MAATKTMDEMLAESATKYSLNDRFIAAAVKDLARQESWSTAKSDRFLDAVRKEAEARDVRDPAVLSDIMSDMLDRFDNTSTLAEYPYSTLKVTSIPGEHTLSGDFLSPRCYAGLKPDEYTPWWTSVKTADSSFATDPLKTMTEWIVKINGTDDILRGDPAGSKTATEAHYLATNGGAGPRKDFSVEAKLALRALEKWEKQGGTISERAASYGRRSRGLWRSALDSVTPAELEAAKPSEPGSVRDYLRECGFGEDVLPLCKKPQEKKMDDHYHNLAGVPIYKSDYVASNKMYVLSGTNFNFSAPMPPIPLEEKKVIDEILVEANETTTGFTKIVKENFTPIPPTAPEPNPYADAFKDIAERAKAAMIGCDRIKQAAVMAHAMAATSLEKIKAEEAAKKKSRWSVAGALKMLARIAIAVGAGAAAAAVVQVFM